MLGFSRRSGRRVSLYADDLTVFLAPMEQDFRMVAVILEIFAGASGLQTNISKCQLTPIQCSKEQIQVVQQIFPCQLINFPCKYLGETLSIHKLSKVELQSLLDAVADRLPNWKCRFMSRAGRTTLTKVTLSAIPIHISIAMVVSPGYTRPLINYVVPSFGLAVTKFKVANVW
jgi:hypothetical protein